MAARLRHLAAHLSQAHSAATPVDDGDVLVEQQGHVLIITLNRGHKPAYNGFTPSMFIKLSEAFTHMEKTKSVRVGVIRGAGKHFCAGIDMGQVTNNCCIISTKKEIEYEYAQVTFDAKLFPVGEVDPCVGLEIALAADIIVAAKGTRFGQLEVKRATISFFGGTFRIMERAGYSNAMRYLLTGDEFDEVKAKEMGIVQEIAETPEEAFAKAVEIAERIALQAPLAVKETLKSANAALDQGMAFAVNMLAGQVRQLRETKDFEEGVLSFKEKRNAKYTGE